MARTRVQTSPFGTSTVTLTVQTTFAAPPVLGRAVLVTTVRFAAAGMTSVTDNYGNTYTRVSFNNGSSNYIEVWICGSILATGPTFRVTATSPVTNHLFVMAIEVSGALALNQVVISNGVGPSAPSGVTPALTGTADFFALAMIGAPSSFFTQPAQWTEEVTYNGPSIKTEVDTRSLAASASGTTLSLTWSVNGAATYATILSVFHAVPGAFVTVPDLTGLTQAEAVAAILAAGLVPGQVLKEKNDKVPPGQVIRQDPPPETPTPPSTPVNLVVSGGAGNGVQPIAMLQGKVNAAGELLVSTTAPSARTASLDSATALTDAVLIPAPPPGTQIVVTRLAVSAHVAGAFDVTFREPGDRILGPIWLPGSGVLAVATDRVFATGPIRRALPPGEGLRVTTSADGPQAIDAEYVIAGGDA